MYIAKKVKNLSEIISKNIIKYKKFQDILKNLLLLCAFLALNRKKKYFSTFFQANAVTKLSMDTLDLIVEIFNYSEDEDIVEASVMTLKSFSFDLQSRIKMVGNSNLILRLLTFKRHQNQQISTSVKAIIDLLSLNEKSKDEEVDFDIVFPKLRSKQPAVVEKAAKQIQSACNASVSRVVSEGAIEPLDFALNHHVDLETLEEVLKTLSNMSSNGNLIQC
jgi:hypothetical protein